MKQIQSSMLPVWNKGDMVQSTDEMNAWYGQVLEVGTMPDGQPGVLVEVRDEEGGPEWFPLGAILPWDSSIPEPAPFCYMTVGELESHRAAEQADDKRTMRKIESEATERARYARDVNGKPAPLRVPCKRVAKHVYGDKVGDTTSWTEWRLDGDGVPEYQFFTEADALEEAHLQNSRGNRVLVFKYEIKRTNICILDEKEPDQDAHNDIMQGLHDRAVNAWEAQHSNA